MAATGDLSGGTVFLAYTTSQIWSGATKPLGVYTFDRDEAAGMGQSRPFTLDLRRLAIVPATAEWFPLIETPGRGVVGRAAQRMREMLEAVAKDLLQRRPDLIEQLGPVPPRGRR